MPSSTFLSELTGGLTRFCSIREIKPLVTPARFANSRCDSPYICRTDFKWAPTSKVIMFIILNTEAQWIAKIELSVDFPYHPLTRPKPLRIFNERSSHSRTVARRSRRILDAIYCQPAVQIQ